MKKYLTVLCVLGALTLLIRLPSGSGNILNRHRHDSANIFSVIENKHDNGQQNIRPEIFFEKRPLGAASAIIVEYSTGKVLYEKNADEIRPLASLTKLMTALAVNEIEKNKNDSPFPLVAKIDNDAIRQEGDSRLYEGEEFFASELSDIMLAGSSNDAAYALSFSAGSLLLEENDAYSRALPLFITFMNARAQALGFSHFTFLNVTGLDIDKQFSGGYGTLRDTAGLFRYMLSFYPELLSKTALSFIHVTSFSGMAHEIKNSNPLTVSLPGVIASKTGFSDLAGGNVIVAVDAGFQKPVIIGVMGSTFDGRFQDVFSLYEGVLEYYNTK